MTRPDLPRQSEDALHDLLSRTPDAAYLRAWQETLRHAIFGEQDRKERAAVLFRVGEQWLGLDPQALTEVRPWAPVRQIPGRTNSVFRGLVSIRGELHLCGDLHALLGVAVDPPPGPAGHAPRGPRSRLLTVGTEGHRWTLEVDEVRGVMAYAAASVLPPQSTVAKALMHITDGLIPFDEVLAARIDPPRLLASLERSLQA